MVDSDFTPVAGACSAQNDLLRSMADKFAVTDNDLRSVADEVYSSIVNGLQTDDTDSNPHGLPCRVSYVKSEITQDMRQAEGTDQIALGLTINTSLERFKIASVRLHGNGQADEVNKQIFRMAQGASASPGQLFQEAATHVAEFINSHNLDSAKQPLPLGVTIDLPLEETSKRGGRVVCSTSACNRMFGNVDIARSLDDQMTRQHLPVRVTATTNCSISTMVAAQRRFAHTCVALILNHGINAAYYERAREVPKLHGTPLGESDALVAINTELARYGAGSSALRPTMWDHRVDRESMDTGAHVFEKLVADKYMGEIVRNLITDFMDARLLFPKDADATMFSKPYSFFTSYMTIMEDTSEDLHEVGGLLNAGFNVQASAVDRQIVATLCRIVAMRAARLVGAAVAGIVRRAAEATGKPAVVSISGQLTEMNQPYVRCTVETAKRLALAMQLDEPSFNVLGEDGYTVGAALASLSK
ncbi:hypothetical protein LPJ73_005960 [Coemansia sp. RSA 2703]|nr:hypothetical protein LPJ73_005960 [Coemansia sp. RSA 2703]